MVCWFEHQGFLRLFSCNALVRSESVIGSRPGGSLGIATSQGDITADHVMTVAGMGSLPHKSEYRIEAVAGGFMGKVGVWTQNTNKQRLVNSHRPEESTASILHLRLNKGNKFRRRTEKETINAHSYERRMCSGINLNFRGSIK